MNCPKCGLGAGPDDIFCSQCGGVLPTRSAVTLVGHDADKPVGQVIDGRFRVMEWIGSGGMADVYLAEQTAVHRPVALKLLKPEFSSEARYEESFRREALAASRLNHPNTVTIHDFGRHEQFLYIAMEYIRGRTLADADRPIEWRRAATICAQVSGSLQNAHDHGVIHRDLKAENVMLFQRGDERDRAKVLDFGIARIGHEVRQKSVTESGSQVVMGTPHAMAPETLMGDGASAASDIYSLGVLLYQLLTGRLPFAAKNIRELIRAQLFTQPKRIAEWVPDARVPPDLERLVRDLLAKKPDERPASMQAVREGLERVGGGDALGIVGTGPVRIQATTPPPTAPPGAAIPHAVDVLIKRINRAPDFPAFAGNVHKLNELCIDPDATGRDVADSVLGDFGLTEKLLRLANSTFYRRHNAPTVKVSRAVMLLGFEQVRRISTSLLFWQHLNQGGRGHGALLNSAMRSLASALFARDLAGELEGVDGEEAFVCSMFRNFGRQLVALHMPEPATQIQQLTAAGRMTEDEASRNVLGASFEDIGLILADQLSFPDVVVASMKPVDPSAGPADHDGQLHLLAALTNAISDALEAPPAMQAQRLQSAMERYGKPLSLAPKQVEQMLASAAEKFESYTATIDIDVSQTRLHKALMERAAAGEMADDEHPDAALAGYVERVRRVAQEGAALNALVGLVIEGMHIGAGFERVVFALKNFKTGEMAGRLGLGCEQGFVKAFAFDTRGDQDLLQMALSHGSDLVVEDTRLPSVRNRLPGWYLDLTKARSLAIYPVMVRGVAVGLLYGDSRERARPEWLRATRQRMIRDMRVHLVHALRQIRRAPKDEEPQP